ncbi:hypothetical protein [Halogeometricum luteum]|uniref:DUF8130 domain-containing protein n=1 Tax=Halogeometricum luteum TaxID=2950537 RepID=A0ABU2FW31_9EURY|nr:hypothetical protein [Halogeometricum sp. S3BR5-2]MDS0292752.1 hypothetical protein [Halogeometricum sp. S3BR5-2]
MRRRALLSASVLSLAGLSGCLGDVRRQVSGRVTASHATAVMHPADEPWIRGGLSADSDRTFHAELFTEAPDDVYRVFTEAFPRRREQLDNDVRNDDYATGFSLLAEAKMPRGEAYSLVPVFGEAWTGWDAVSLPLETNPYDDDPTDGAGESDELLCTMLARYEAGASPSRATVTVYEETGDEVIRELTAEPRF